MADQKIYIGDVGTAIELDMQENLAGFTSLKLRVRKPKVSYSFTGLTADSSGCSGTILKDTGANFITKGIVVGDIIHNITEKVIAYVISVDNENQLTTTFVESWTSDSYEIVAVISGMELKDWTAEQKAGMGNEKILVHVTLDEEVNVTGEYYLQPYGLTTGWKGHGNPVTLQVLPLFG